VQTAVSAYYVKQDGFALAYETPVLGPPWSVPMEFPTYQFAVAAVSRVTGMKLEQAGRLISVVFFYAALPAVWLLLGRWRLSPTVRTCALLAFLTCPIFLFYSRTFMIESTALSLCLWFLWAFWTALEEFSWWRLVLAVGLGALAALTKVTTFVVFFIPASLLAVTASFSWKDRRFGVRSWRTVLIAGTGLVLPVAAAYAWVRYSDQQKALNPLAGFLISSNLHDWNWGTLAQRCSGVFWAKIYSLTKENMLSEPALLVLLALLPAVSRAARWRVLACLAFYFGGCLTFSNLYYVHDYYSYASVGFLMAAFGILLGTVLEESSLPLAASAAIVALALVSQLLIFSRSYGSVYHRPNFPPSPFAEIIRRTTGREDVLIAFGLDWNPTIPYYSERRSIMMPNHLLSDGAALTQSIRGLAPRRVGAMIVTGTLRGAVEFLTPRIREFGLEPYPIAATKDMDLYLRSDLHDRARHDLLGNQYPGVTFTLQRKVMQDDLPSERSFAEPVWNGQLTMMSPAPYAWRGPFMPGVSDEQGKPALHTHAPFELLFQPATTARHVEATGGLIPDAYTHGNASDGVVLQILEEMANGERQVLSEHVLDPLHVAADRKEFTVRYTSDHAFNGRIVIRLDPGPLGNRNCDWGYWTSIKIH
jgi:hypothetical protein